MGIQKSVPKEMQEIVQNGGQQSNNKAMRVIPPCTWVLKGRLTFVV